MFFKKKSKYNDELNEAKYVITHDVLPHKVKTDEPGLFARTLRIFLRKNDWSDDITTGVEDNEGEPNKKGVWLNRRRKR